MRLDRRALSRAKPENLLRLAKYIGAPTGDCFCAECNVIILEVIVRKLDLEDKKSSYEEIIERLNAKYK